MQPRTEITQFLAVCGCAEADGLTGLNPKNMKKDLNSKRRPSGSEKMNEPKVIGKVLIEYLESEEPLAVEFRHRKAINEAAKVNEEQTEKLFEDIYPNTELGIDLKLFTLKPGRIGEGEFLAGMLTRDGADRYCFVENAPKKKRVVNPRNPQLFKGSCINVNQQTDGSMYLSFCRPRFTEDYTFKHFCLKAAEELLMVAGLVEK